MATTKRTYGDRCGVARALDIVGERWALLVVRELLLGPKRFTDLRAGLPHVGPDILAQRLRELEASGVVRRGTLPPPAGSRIYELTERGQQLEPVVLALGRFGSVAPFPPGEAQIGVDALVIALKTLFAPSAADGLSASYELRLGEQHFRLRGGRRAARASPAGAPRRPTPTIETDAGTLATVLWHGRDARRGAPRAATSSSAATRRPSRASSGCSRSRPDAAILPSSASARRAVCLTANRPRTSRRDPLRERFDAGTGLVAVGAVLLLVSLFIDWYDPGGDAWAVFESLDLVLAGAAVCGLLAVAPRFGTGGLGRALPVISVVAFADRGRPAHRSAARGQRTPTSPPARGSPSRRPRPWPAGRSSGRRASR